MTLCRLRGAILSHRQPQSPQNIWILTQEAVWAFWLGASMMPLPFALQWSIEKGVDCRYAAELARSSTEESSGSYACWYFQALLKNLDWRKVDIGRKTRAAHRNEPLLQQYNVTNCSPFQGSSPCRCPVICKGRDMHLGAIKVKVSPNQKWNF